MEGAKAISGMLKDQLYLEDIPLIDTGLDCDTLQEICKGIKQSDALQYVDLKQNIFDKRGLRSLIDSLKANMCVKHLYLESVMIHFEEAKLLSAYIK